MAEKKSLLRLAKGLHCSCLGKSIINVESHSCHAQFLPATSMLACSVNAFYFMETLSKQQGLLVKESEVAQSCLTLCDPVDCSLPGSTIHGILQARILEWVAISFSRGSSRPRDWTWVSRIGGRCFNLWATRVSLVLVKYAPTWNTALESLMWWVSGF